MKLVALSFLLLSHIVCCSRNNSGVVATNNSSTPVQRNATKKDDSADLNALDAAMAMLPAAPTTPVPKVEAKPAKALKGASHKAHAKRVVPHLSKKLTEKSARALNAVNAPSKEDVKLSDLAKKDQHFAVKEVSEDMLEAGDALAEKAEDAKHRKELEKLAPANVVHVDAPTAKSDANEGLDSAKTLASDLEGLKERAAEQKEQKVEDQKQEEKRKLRAQKVKAIKEKRAQRESRSPKEAKKQRALNLDKLVKLTNDIKHTAFVQQDKPAMETHSTLEAHASKLDEAQKEVDEMNGKAAPRVEKNEVEAPEPRGESAAPSNQAHKVTGVNHHPENADHLKNIEQAVGHLNEATGDAPAAVKEVQEVLKKAQAMTSGSQNTSVTRLAADPHEAKLRAKKFKNKMENHVDAMQEALHEHQKKVETQIHLEKIRKQREAEAAEHAKWEVEQARLKQLKIAAENIAREQREKEETQALENRTVTEAAHRVDDPQAEFRARHMRKPQETLNRSTANAIQRCGLVFLFAAAFLSW